MIIPTGIKFLPPIFRLSILLFALSAVFLAAFAVDAALDAVDFAVFAVLFAVFAVDTALLALAFALLIAFAKTGFVVVVLPLLNVMCDLVQIYFPDSQLG